MYNVVSTSEIQRPARIRNGVVLVFVMQVFFVGSFFYPLPQNGYRKGDRTWFGLYVVARFGAVQGERSFCCHVLSTAQRWRRMVRDRQERCE